MDKTLQIIEKTLGITGRLMAGSKSGYSKAYPENFPVFNSNLVIEEDGAYKKVWHGDLDLTVDSKKLMKASKQAGKKFYVLYEMDARFDTETAPRVERFITSYDGSTNEIELGPQYEPYMLLTKDEKDGSPYVKLKTK